MHKRIIVLASSVAAFAAFTASAYAEDSAPAAEPLYATVNGKPITQRDFQNAFMSYLRDKFYHGQIPEDQIAAAKTEVGDRLVDRILLLDDAKRRGLVADEKQIDETIAGYEARYANSERWQQNKERMLPGVRQQLAEQDLLRQMETIGHTVADPSDEAVRHYYDKHPELFTEPEKLHLHTIMLKVDPSAPKATWDAAREEAARLVARMRDGSAKFEDLAALHSQDRSADQGGDMGYIHRGMIPDPVQEQIEKNPLGTIGDPVDVLEGVAIFRLDERVPAKLMPYDAVAARAKELLLREQRNSAWQDFIAALRKTADIKSFEPAAPAAN